MLFWVYHTTKSRPWATILPEKDGLVIRKELNMVELSIQDLKKEYVVGATVLDGLSFQINTGERVGILGKNGAGKTTLLRIITGEEEADSGQVVIAPGKRLGLISQIPVYPAGYTVEKVLLTAFDGLFALEAEMGDLAARMGQESGDPALLRRYDTLMAAFESQGGYETETRLGKVCNGLGIPPEMREKEFADLSGGEKTRVNLARLLLVDTDILLLDEPTNHLDLNATQWLEEYLEKYKGTVLAISHDRYFLDKVVTRVVELREGKAEFYSGNYSFYAVEKERRYLEQLRQYEKEQAEYQRLSETARKMHEHNTEHLNKRAFSIEKRMAKLAVTDRPTKEKSMNVRFGQREFHGDELLLLRELDKSFGAQTLFAGVDLKIEDGDRIALIGDNGTGKSTLLKIIMGEEDPDHGKLKQGPTVKIGYLPQQIHFSHPERNLVDTMLYDLNCSVQEARDRLAGFQFRGDEVYKQVSDLSGGEQSRLRLCMLMDSKINLLILDEPTNHLDLASREWIEGAVEEYEGALLFVSHDRYFIDRFANRIWTLEDGKIQDYRGDYQAYQAMRERMKTIAPPPKKETASKPVKEKRTGGGTKQKRKDLSGLEKKLAKLEQQLQALAREREEVAQDYKALEETMGREAAVTAEYDEVFLLWAALAEELDGEEA